MNRLIPIIGCGVALLAVSPAQAASFRGSFETATWQSAAAYTEVDAEQGTSPQLFVDQTITRGSIVTETFAQTTTFTATGRRLANETISGTAAGTRCVIDTATGSSSCSDATISVQVTWTASGSVAKLSGHGITKTRSAQATGIVGRQSVDGEGLLGYAVVA